MDDAMNEDKKRASCGCDCDSCMKGDHEHCTKPDQCDWTPEDKEGE